MSERTIRFGVVGAGRIAAEQFVPALRTVRGVELAAAASRDRARAAALRPRRVLASYEELLDDPDLDAVYIATHNGLHREQALRALASGKHVLCEKPLGRDTAECEELAAAARRAQRHLVEAFMYRHHPQIAKAQELLAAGTIGDLRVVETAFSFKMTRTDDVRLRADWGGGALLDVGCYCVNLCRLLLGHEPAHVQARAWFEPRHGVDLGLHGTLDYGDGRFGVISCGFDSGLRQHAVLSGTEGTLTLTRPFVSWLTAPELIVERGSERTVERFAKVNVFAREIEDLAAAIRTGRPPLLDPDEGARNARIMDALLASARGSSGRP
jgi:predicted dehydrogenase